MTTKLNQNKFYNTEEFHSGLRTNLWLEVGGRNTLVTREALVAFAKQQKFIPKTQSYSTYDTGRFAPPAERSWDFSLTGDIRIRNAVAESLMKQTDLMTKSEKFWMRLEQLGYILASFIIPILGTIYLVKATNTLDEVYVDHVSYAVYRHFFDIKREEYNVLGEDELQERHELELQRQQFESGFIMGFVNSFIHLFEESSGIKIQEGQKKQIFDSMKKIIDDLKRQYNIKSEIRNLGIKQLHEFATSFVKSFMIGFEQSTGIKINLSENQVTQLLNPLFDEYEKSYNAQKQAFQQSWKQREQEIRALPGASYIYWPFPQKDRP